MSVSKVIYNSNVLMDSTSVTISPITLGDGLTAIDSSGSIIEGITSFADLSKIAASASYYSLSGLFESMQNGSFEYLIISIASGTNPITINFGHEIHGFISYPQTKVVISGLENDDRMAFWIFAFDPEDENGHQAVKWSFLKGKNGVQEVYENNISKNVYRLSNWSLNNGILSIVPQYPTNTTYNSFTFN